MRSMSLYAFQPSQMKSYLSLLITLLMLVFCTANAEVEVPDDLRFVIADPHHMNPDERASWLRKLHGTPNIGGRLCDLLWEFYLEGSDEGIGWIIGALMARDDIPPTQLKRITDEMRRLASMSISDVQKMGVRNLLYGVRILERYPSPEHEELAILLLNSEDTVVRSNAATTLGRIGTERSREPMRKHYDPFRYIKTDPPHHGAQSFEAEQMLLARLAAKSGAAAPTFVPTTSKKSLPATDTSSPISEESFSSTPWSVVGVLILASTGLLWLLVKKRK